MKQILSNKAVFFCISCKLHYNKFLTGERKVIGRLTVLCKPDLLNMQNLYSNLNF